MPGLLRKFGVAPAAVLAEAGLDPHDLDDPEATIPYAVMNRLLDLSSTATRCLHFGLLVGQQIDVSTLGVIGKLMSSAPTLGVALMDLVTNQHRHARGSTVYLFRRKGRALFGYTVYQHGFGAVGQIYDGAAAAAFGIVCSLLNSDNLSGVQVSVSRTRPSDEAPYLLFFKTRVRFDAKHTGVSIPESWLERPVYGANSDERSSLEKLVAAYQLAGPNDVVTQVRRAISMGLLTGEVSGAKIAAVLGYSERTLQRRLAEHTVSFQDLLDNARYGLARHFLLGTKLTVRDIASIVGFAETSVFTRAFSLWAGMPPSEWRARGQAM